MKINVLGCSGGIGSGLRTTALRVDMNTLLDCGTGVGDLPLDDLFQIKHVFITHSHLDHVAGLPLLVDTIYESLINEPLTVHCQLETYQVLMDHIFNWKIWPNFFCLPNDENPVVRFAPMQPGKDVIIDDKTFSMVEVEHTVPAVGYMVQDSSTGSSFAFSGDTASAPKLWNMLNQQNKVDLLIVECAFADERSEIANQAKHFSPQSLARELTSLTHQLQVCVSHLQPGEEEKIMQELRLAMPERDIRSIVSGDILVL
ncbi:MAG: 3',5'-cyclic-nucleotide phosphodiesterase [Gammaproteobacteria bacterium]|nr:3',5'-cyclic-nucleotide phosphodiesterase [Gammaproteobacteria bacterium]